MTEQDPWASGPDWQDAWIVGQSIDGERDYVVHLIPPRCVIECVESDDGEIETGTMEFIDPVPTDEIERLIREAIDVFADWEVQLEAEYDD